MDYCCLLSLDVCFLFELSTLPALFIKLNYVRVAKVSKVEFLELDTQYSITSGAQSRWNNNYKTTSPWNISQQYFIFCCMTVPSIEIQVRIPNENSIYKTNYTYELWV